ncbi:MAG: flavin reductase, partial [FCB group bacterium]|nr:flavin reductase [FCB group bacterium]
MEPDHRKTVLRKIPNGLFIVTSRWNGNPAASVISFLTQTSIEPPLITMAIRRVSHLCGTVKRCGHVAVHFPEADQKDLVADFFKIKNIDSQSINGYPYRISDLGNPLLDDMPMILEGKVVEIVPRGDHHLFICEIVNTIMR